MNPHVIRTFNLMVLLAILTVGLITCAKPALTPIAAPSSGHDRSDFIGWPTWNPDQASNISTIGFSNDGRWLAAGSQNDGLIFLWDLRGLPLLRALPAERGLGKLFFTPDSRYLIAAFGKTLYEWKPLKNDPPKTVPFLSSDLTPIDQFGPVALSSDGRTLAVSVRWRRREVSYDDGQGHRTFKDIGADSALYFYDVPSLTMRAVSPAAGDVHSIAFSPDNSQFIAAMTVRDRQYDQFDEKPVDGNPIELRIQSWRLRDAQPIWSTPLPVAMKAQIFFDRSGQQLIVKTSKIWNVDFERLQTIPGTMEAKTGRVISLQVSRNSTAPSTQPDTLELCKTFRGDAVTYEEAKAVSPDGRLHASAGNGALMIDTVSRSQKSISPSQRVTIQIAVFPINKRPHYSVAEPLQPPTELAGGVEWFIDVQPRPPRLDYSAPITWDGSANSNQFVSWNLHMTGAPGPSSDAVEKHYVPDLLHQILNAKP